MATIALLISSCDKFSDLWDEHITLYRSHWKGKDWKTYLVTDKHTNKNYDGIEIIAAGEDKDFPMRIKYAVERIDTDFILLTLDDYFIINDIFESRLMYLVNRAETEGIDYLKLYDRRMTNPRKYSSIAELSRIDLTRKYAVTLYPAIWNRLFLLNSVSKDMTPWIYESSLTAYARDVQANCMFSHAGTFEILDVVRKGRVLHRADWYFRKHNIDIGERPLLSRTIEVKLFAMDIVSWYAPRWLFIATKRVLRRLGMEFYSED